MNAISVTFELPEPIANGIAIGKYIRNGGVIQDQQGRIITWLRENPNLITNTLNLENSNLINTLNETFQVVDTAVSQLEKLQTLAAVSNITSILSLGVTTLGFSVIYHQIQGLETRLKTLQTSLELVGEKIDLALYANFRAATALARNALTMQDPQNRRNSALQAIDRFLAAEHVYLELTDRELAQQGVLIDEYLRTLCLAYFAETRCYLELGEYPTARQRLNEGINILKPRITQYIQILLTKNPIIYLHPRLIGQVDLTRLTRIYQWLNPSETESSVFEKLRIHLDKLSDVKTWSQNLPAPLTQQIKTIQAAQAAQTAQTAQTTQKLPVDLPQNFLGFKESLTGITDNLRGLLPVFTVATDESQDVIFNCLAEAIAKMEIMIETIRRFESYEYEVKLLKKTKIPFKRWLNLAPKDTQTTTSNLMFITPAQAITLSV